MREEWPPPTAPVSTQDLGRGGGWCSTLSLGGTPSKRRLTAACFHLFYRQFEIFALKQKCAQRPAGRWQEVEGEHAPYSVVWQANRELTKQQHISGCVPVRYHTQLSTRLAHVRTNTRHQSMETPQHQRPLHMHVQAACFDNKMGKGHHGQLATLCASAPRAGPTPHGAFGQTPTQQQWR